MSLVSGLQQELQRHPKGLIIQRLYLGIKTLDVALTSMLISLNHFCIFTLLANKISFNKYTSIRISFPLEEGCSSSILLCIWCWVPSPLHWDGSEEGSVPLHLEVLHILLHPGCLGVRAHIQPPLGDEAARRKPTLGCSAGIMRCLHWVLLAASWVSLVVPPSPLWLPLATLGVLPRPSHLDP